MPQRNAWKVLIIDDQRVDREICKRYLEKATKVQFDFAEADAAVPGIELSKSWRPDCILLDFHLPDMDGLDALPRLRGKNGNLPCAVIMLTACGGEELAVNALKRGAMDYLSKGQLGPDVLPQSVVNAIERFRMQQRIEEQRSALDRIAHQQRTLIEAIPHMVWMANAEGRVEYANRQWFEYTGLGLDLTGQWGWDNLLHPDDRDRTWTAWDEARQAGLVFEIENRIKRAADGSYRWHLVRAVPFRDSSGEVTNWFGSFTEIENQKHAELLHLQKEKLESIGQLAAGVAHDFNNLLVVILGGASYAMEALPPTHEAQGMLQGVVHAGERAAELTGRMLAYAGKGNFYVERTDINKLVHDVCDSLRPSIPEDIQLDIRNANHLPAVNLDSHQMRQVIADLVRNAVEAIGEGRGGRVSVGTAVSDVSEGSTSTVAAGRYVELDVRDTGCGMNEEVQKKIFDPFFTTKFMGRGLGLAAVNGFARTVGGGVEVESQPGKGSRFRLLVPVESSNGQTGTSQ